MNNVKVKTSYGNVIGATVQGINCFYNIPYAAPPVGSLRYMPPTKHPGWRGSQALLCNVWERREAVQDLTGGTQGEGVPFDRSVDPKDFSDDNLPTWMSEDCLYLQVYSPANAKNLPVLYWIHGGGFTIGTGCSPQYHGLPQAKQGNCVIVSINYRLNGFGFLHLPGQVSSNLGLQDQIFGLKWVQEEIQNFGGDPNNVLIYGESAGGMSVGCLCGSPLAKNLFHKAIPQSGATHHVSTERQANQVASDLAKNLGWKHEEMTLEKLQKVPASVLFKAITKVSSAGMAWQPTLAAPVLPVSPFKAIQDGICKDVDIFGGACAEENRMFTYGMRKNHPTQTMAGAEQFLTRYLLADSPFINEYRGNKEKAVEKAKTMLAELKNGNNCNGVADLPNQPGGSDSDSNGPGRTDSEVVARLNSDLMFDFPLKRLLDAHSNSVEKFNGKGKTYCYQFAFQSPIISKKLGRRMGSCHALEMGFNFGFIGMDYEQVFGPAFYNYNEKTGKECRTQQIGNDLIIPQEFAGALNFMGAIDRQRNKVPIAHDLAKVMVDCWTTFARTGTPSPDLPQYSTSNPYTIVFGEGQTGTYQVKNQFLRGFEIEKVYNGIKTEIVVNNDNSRL
tara:strand:+ start:136 stop:1983 length:1848 start_codon:yes stop_codon:yes gene_type:complete